MIVFMFGGLVQSQGTQEFKAEPLVDVGKTYRVQWSGGTAAVEFKVIGRVDDCWVKVERSRKTYDYTHVNLCSAMVLRAE